MEESRGEGREVGGSHSAIAPPLPLGPPPQSPATWACTLPPPQNGTGSAGCGRWERCPPSQLRATLGPQRASDSLGPLPGQSPLGREVGAPPPTDGAPPSQAALPTSPIWAEG